MVRTEIVFKCSACGSEAKPSVRLESEPNGTKEYFICPVCSRERLMSETTFTKIFDERENAIEIKAQRDGMIFVW